MNEKYKEGYYWVNYKDFNVLYIVKLEFVTHDNTRDGDRWVIFDVDEMIEENNFYKYQFIERVKEPEFPYNRLF